MTQALKEQPKKEEVKPAEKTEVQEVMETVKAFEVKGSNEQDVEKTKLIVEGAIKIAEIRKQKELEIQKMKQEMEAEMIRVGERIKEKQMKYEANYKTAEKIVDCITTMGVAAVAGFVSLSIIDKNKTIELEKIKQGLTN